MAINDDSPLQKPVAQVRILPGALYRGTAGAVRKDTETPS